MFIVGHLRGAGGRKVFPLDQADREIAAEPQCVGMLDIKGQDVIRRVYAPTGAAPTLTTMAGGNREPKIIQRSQSGVREHDVCATLRAGASTLDITVQVSAVLTPDREEKRQNGRRVKEPDEPMFTLTAQDKHGILVTRKGYGEESEWVERDTVTCLDANYFKGLDAHQLRTGVAEGTRVRKLTPRECWRLMGRQDWEFDRAKAAGISDSQLYKLAGNGLIPQIVTEIAKHFEGDE